MTLLLVTDTFTPVVSGVVTVVKEYARALLRHYSVCVLAPNDSRQYTTRKKYRVQYVLVPSIRNPVRTDHRIGVPSYRFIYRAIAAIRPDSIHIHTPGILGLCTLLAARSYHIPVIATVHSVPEFVTSYTHVPLLPRLLYRILWLYYRWFNNQTRRIIAPSRYIKRRLRQHGVTTQIDIIPMWTESLALPRRPRALLRSSLNIPTDAFVFLYFGRIDPDKNLEVFVDAFAAVSLQHQYKVHLVLAGEGRSKPRLRSRIARQHLQDAVTLLGYIPKQRVTEIYAAADVFVMPAKYEAQSLVTLQAIRLGLPCILARAGALPEIAQRFPEQCSLIAPTREDLESIMVRWAKRGLRHRRTFTPSSRRLTDYYGKQVVRDRLIATYSRVDNIAHQ